MLSSQLNTDASTTLPPSTLPDPAIEASLAQLISHRSVQGYLLLARATPPRIIRHAGAIFEGTQGKRYAHAVIRIVEGVQVSLTEIAGGKERLGSRNDGSGNDGSGNDEDEVRFIRIRSKRHEIMISPDERYLLAVLHNLTAGA